VEGKNLTNSSVFSLLKVGVSNFRYCLVPILILLLLSLLDQFFLKNDQFGDGRNLLPILFYFVLGLPLIIYVSCIFIFCLESAWQGNRLSTWAAKSMVTKKKYLSCVGFSISSGIMVLLLMLPFGILLSLVGTSMSYYLSVFVKVISSTLSLAISFGLLAILLEDKDAENAMKGVIKRILDADFLPPFDLSRTNTKLLFLSFFLSVSSILIGLTVLRIADFGPFIEMIVLKLFSAFIWAVFLSGAVGLYLELSQRGEEF